MRRVWLLPVLAGLLAGCNTDGTSGSGAEVPVVGFVQYTSTSSLDDCREGFIEGLAEGGFKDGESVKVVVQNAHADVATLNMMVQKLRDDQVDLIGTASTQSLQSASRNIKEIPVVFCGVIDPVAAGAAESLDKPKENITGIYNPFPVAEGVQMVHDVMPQAKVIGTLFDPSEPFSNPMQAEAKEACQRLGIQWVAVPISAATDIVSGMQALQSRGVQAVLQLPTNTVNQGVDAQVAEGSKLKLPIFSLQTDQLTKGVVAAVGIDFRRAGHEAGLVAAEILKGKKPSEVPLKKAEIQGLGINVAAAKKFGITFPVEITEGAKEVVGQ